MSQHILERAIAANPPKFRLGQRVNFSYDIHSGRASGTGIITGIQWELKFEAGVCTWNYSLDTLVPIGEQDSAWEDELEAVMEVAA